jgi:pilus assembly protein Flp/PilA
LGGFSEPFNLRLGFHLPWFSHVRRSGEPDEEPKHMKSLFKQFVRDESGATAIEYGLIASLIALVIIGAVGALGNKLMGTFNEVTSNLK